MSETSSPGPLPTGYYLENFKLVISFIQEHHSKVLSDDERMFIEEFDLLDRECQYLYLRLISRKGPFFRSDKLSYSEIPDLKPAALKLELAGFLSINPQIELDDLCELLLKAELLTHFSDQLKEHKHLRKDELISVLKGNYSTDASELELPFDIYEPLGTENFSVFRLLFFGNLWQDFSEFVLQDLGLMRYEEYPIRPEDSIFQDRGTIDSYLLLHELRELAWVAREEQAYHLYPDILENIPSADSEARLTRMRGRLLNEIARDYERLGGDDISLRLYADSTEPPARERSLRLYFKHEQLDEAKRLCDEMLSKPADEHEAELAKRFASKIAGEKQTRILERSFNPVDLQLPEHTQVEQAVAEHFTASRRKAYFVENSLMLGLFGLLCWDIVFMPLPGVFFNRFQSGPADLFTADFFPRRESLFQQRLEDLIEIPDLTGMILELYDEKAGISNHLVHWGQLSEELIEVSTRLIPREHLQNIFRRMAFDLKSNRSGLPDLAVFDEQNQSYKFVEVKGPGDHLQANQKRWLTNFDSWQIPYEVAWVNWISERADSDLDS